MQEPKKNQWKKSKKAPIILRIFTEGIDYFFLMLF